jgi:hypothetical protein
MVFSVLSHADLIFGGQSSISGASRKNLLPGDRHD